MKKLITLILVISSALAGCPKSPKPQDDGGKLKVAATIFPLADIARTIGGDKITVITIMPPGSSPHTFEPTVEVIRQAGGIKALFAVGCGLDGWGQKITESLGGNVAVIEVSNDIKLRHFEDGSADPHYWLSLTNGEIIARNIAENIIGLDPENKDYYLKNLADYQELLTKEDAAIKQKLAGLPNKTIATFHEAWFYFAQAYGLTVAEAFEPFPGKEPTPEFLSHFIDTIKKHNITVVFAEPQFSPESIRQVAKDLNLKVRIIDPEGGGTPQTKSYIDMMKFNTDVIYAALINKQ
jgi:zinc transport system substrate-binding protein